MEDIILPILIGVLFGLSIALVSFRLATSQQIKKAKESGMYSIYEEIVIKRKYSDYQYSDETKRVMEKVHLSQILE
ncbi:hypothetical protein EOL70_05870 [Leucothrix sargassi]|nr:hypothetical protein EOL70_05870 [Leucothrix sargassi]